MKSNTRSKIIILITLGILFAFLPIFINNPRFTARDRDITSNYNNEFDHENLKLSAVSGKIHIDGNSGWTAFKAAGNCTGSGTYSDPYIIEDLEIDAGGSGNCILIENSNVYFKIENCSLYNAGWGSDAGIRLLNVNNSQLIGNDCSSSYLGIDLSNGSYNNTIAGNIVNNNGGGIHLFISDNNTISGNTVNNNLWSGIYLLGSNYTIISENTMNDNDMHGIQLLGSNNNNISGNTMNDNNMVGIRLESSNNNTISGNTANNNNYGIYLLFSNYNTISGNTLIGNDECIVEVICQGNVIQDNESVKISEISEKIHIINNSGWVDFRNAGNCTGSGTYSDPYVIEDLEIDGGGFGSPIWIENSNVYFKIENCTVYNTVGIWNDAGIRLSNVTHSQLINNTCSSNSNGIFLIGCFNNTISGNTARNNIHYGIYILFSNYSTVLGNTASNNYYAGIRLFTSDNSNIMGNTANNNYWDGIHLARSDNNTISNNIANNNGCGIFFYNGSYNTISLNTANNNKYGIELINSNYNIFSGNTLIGNDECIVEVNCQGNIFKDNVCTLTPLLNYLPSILIISITIIGVSVFIIYKNGKMFKKPQEDLDFL